MRKLTTLLLLPILALSGGLRADDAKPAPVKAESLVQLSAKDLRTRAESGDAAAQYEYGRRLSYGAPGIRNDETAGREWLEKSAAQGYVDAMMLMVRLLQNHSGVKYEDVTAKYRELADQGIPAALYEMYGRTSRDEEPESALKWLKKRPTQATPRL